MRMILLVVMLVGWGSCWGEMLCFRTVAEAALQAGVRESDGFWLEGVRRDAFGGKSWATVRSCAHPERPAVTVPGGAVSIQPVTAGIAELGEVVVRGGARIRVLQVERMLRLEMTGIAQGSGRVGDRVWVRILSSGSDGIGRLAVGVVRGTDWLEIVE